MTGSASQDTEITLSTGRLLTLFFGLVAVCAVFFGFGYTLGRGSAKQAGSLVAAEGVPASTVVAGGAKPGAAQAAAVKPSDCAAGQDCSAAGQTAPEDLTFYKAVEQKEASAELTPQEPPTQPGSTPAKAAAPEMKSNIPPVTTATGYTVQIAAVSKKEDAELLKTALQQKQYPVFISNTASDRLFHVQVGPFAELKDAEAMKSKLVGDGYNPIVKR